MIKLSCPHCHQHLEAPTDMSGATVPCPACKQDIKIPSPTAIIIDHDHRRKSFFPPRLNSKQAKTMWTFLGLILLFSIFQLSCSGYFSLNLSNIRYLHLRGGTHFSDILRIVQSSPRWYHITPIFTGLEDHTPYLVIYLVFLAVIALFFQSNRIQPILNKKQRVTVNWTLVVVSFFLLTKISKDKYYSRTFEITPFFSENYELTSHAVFVAIIIILISCALIWTFSSKDTSASAQPVKDLDR